MSRFSDNITYYVFVGITGLLAAALAIGLYIVYTELWQITWSASSFSVFTIIPLSFAAIGLPYFLVKRLAKTKTTGSGTHTVLEAYHLTNGEVNFRDTFVKSVAGMLTIGFGGSAGPEGPSLLAGGGVASALTKRFKVKHDLRRRIFVAGAAAGLAATFRTPLTGILFALEIPYKNDLDRETFIEAIVASIPAYLLSVAVLGAEPIFGTIASTPLTLDIIGLSLLLGSICGLYSVFFTKTFDKMSEYGVKLREKYGDTAVVVLCASSVALSGLISIYSIGVGLHFVSALISGASFSITVLIAVILLKTIITTTTLNWGGSGGLFFPTIVIGAGLGYIFSLVFNVNLSIMFIAVGMAALLAGTHKMLLTPAAFVVETLGGLFAIPALLASGISFVLSGNHSFYPLQPRTRLKNEALALKRFYLRGLKVAPDALKQITESEIMTESPFVLRKGTTVKDALQTFKEQDLRVMPVIDESNYIIGMVSFENLGYLDVGNHELELPEKIMRQPIIIKHNTRLNTIAESMMDNQEDDVYVVDDTSQIIGVISVIDVIKKILELVEPKSPS